MKHMSKEKCMKCMSKEKY